MSLAGDQYDVFISHRGTDKLARSNTKGGFTSFLYRDLTKAGLRVFVDEEELKPGTKDVWTTIKTRLRSSKIAVPVLHESYGNSQWCLRELAIMIETLELAVMPVFLDSGGTAVLDRLKKGADMLAETGKATDQEATAWKAAIDAIGGVTGWRLDQTAGRGNLTCFCSSCHQCT